MSTATKRNAWAIKNTEIAFLKEQIQDYRNKEVLKPFVDDFLAQLGTLLAYTPMDKWPKEAILAFKYAERKAPTTAFLYKERNKKYAFE